MSSYIFVRPPINTKVPPPRWQDHTLFPTLKDFNPVIIVYRKAVFTTDMLMQLAGVGEYVHCELYFPLQKATYAIFIGGVMQCSTLLPQFYKAEPHHFAWHMLILNDSENVRLERWLIDMVKKECTYNMKDLVWQLTPEIVQRSYVSDLTTENAHSPKSLFCSQAIILALRESFSSITTKPHLKNFAKEMNSRITTPSELSGHLVKHQYMPVNTGMVPMTFWDAREEYLNHTPHGFRYDEFPGLTVDIKRWLETQQNSKIKMPIFAGCT